MVFPPIEDVSNDADEVIITTRQHRDICTGTSTFRYVSIQWSRHQDVVEEDEDRSNHTPEHRMMVIPFGFDGFQTSGVLAIMSLK